MGQPQADPLECSAQGLLAADGPRQNNQSVSLTAFLEICHDDFENIRAQILAGYRRYANTG
jgi:hypothetical protein